MTQDRCASIYVIDPIGSVHREVSGGDYGPGAAVHRFDPREDVGLIEQQSASAACCVVLALPLLVSGGGAEEEGEDLLEPLRRLSSQFPTVAIGPRGEGALVEQALRLSVTDIVFQPARPGQIVQAVDAALQLDCQFLSARARRAAIGRQMQLLSSRESEVMDLLVRGRSSKEIGAELEIGVQTVLKHRAHLLKKMRLRNDVELALTVQEYRCWPVHQRPGAGLISLTRREGTETDPPQPGLTSITAPGWGPARAGGISSRTESGRGLSAVPTPPTFRLDLGVSGR